MHLKPERLVAQPVIDINTFQIFNESRSAIPRGPSATGRDIVTKARRYRDGLRFAEMKIGGKPIPIFYNLGKLHLIKRDKVYLIDRQNQMFDAKQRTNRRMSARLGNNTFARINQNHCKI